MKLSNLQKYIIESLLIYLIVPLACVCFAMSIAFLGLTIFIFTIIIPLYTVFAPLRFKISEKVIWFVPIFNAILFMLWVHYLFGSARNLIYYVLASYLVILIKFIINKIKS